MFKKLEWVIKILIAISMTVMVLLVFLNAIMRYVFNSGITEAEELSRYFFIWSVFLGTIIAFKNHLHVGVDLVVERLTSDLKKVFTTIADLASLFAAVVIFLGGIKYTETVLGVRSPATDIPLVFISSSVIVASFAIACIILWRIFKRWGKS